MKSVLVSAWLRVAAWAGFHRRTHPAFSEQALSMVGVSCKRSRSVAIHEARLGRFCCRIPEKFFTYSLSFVQNRLCENSPMAKKYCALPNVARLFQNAEPLSVRRPRLCMTSSRHMGATPIEGRSTPVKRRRALRSGGRHRCGVRRCRWRASCAISAQQCHLNETNATEGYLPFYDTGKL